ncbi:hypothetical protein ACN27F_17400 [Solwaraspora sp. WMMB335]|uniref:hypothetical protein n=1 Tax=Solwaraspora sp. WMMB335 TaxID=3404118 RepID=UPI003B934EBA
MSLKFADNVKGNIRGEIQLFIEKETDRDNDVYIFATGASDDTYGLVTAGWHVGDDPQGTHFTIQLYLDKKHISTAHVYPTGHVTMFSV